MSLEDEIRRIVREEIAKQATPANTNEGFMTVAEAAKHARVSTGTIRKWVRIGELTRHEAGSRVLVKREELERHLACEVVAIDAHLSPEERARRKFG